MCMLCLGLVSTVLFLQFVKRLSGIIAHMNADLSGGFAARIYVACLDLEI
jgi:hypothetical protein